MKCFGLKGVLKSQSKRSSRIKFTVVLLLCVVAFEKILLYIAKNIGSINRDSKFFLHTQSLVQIEIKTVEWLGEYIRE
jgi:hypothetical protein